MTIGVLGVSSADTGTLPQIVSVEAVYTRSVAMDHELPFQYSMTVLDVMVGLPPEAVKQTVAVPPVIAESPRS